MSQIPPAQLWQLLDSKTKPARSLGRLEALAVQLARIQNQVPPRVDRAEILIFAADHGITKSHRVSAFPREVTTQMLHNFARGGAAVCVLAASVGAKMRVFDVGTDGLGEVAGIYNRRVARGTRDFLEGNAMNVSQTRAAMEIGAEAARQSVDNGANVLALGEMGIGNTTSAAALLCLLCGAAPQSVVGHGTGVDGADFQTKIAVVHQAAQLHANKKSALEKLSAVGGLEIAALCGALREAVRARVPVVVDGFIVTVAALCADTMEAGQLSAGLIFSHQGAELGHHVALEKLGARGDHAPLLDFGMRLGEASGAALVLPVLRSAASLFSMANFEEAGIATDARLTWPSSNLQKPHGV